ncbi:MAG: anhydro-N-acetylmuramic acid kinase [Lachnospiraceae bacterium]|nr:anhydro-N-acetylmuramic acid kinase [Lachnospiraceae bacterium]
MRDLMELLQKKERTIIGLMSGTSLDGIDAALVRVSGNYRDTKVKMLSFDTFPFPEGLKQRIFRLFDRDIKSADICHMNFLLGEIFADAAIRIAEKYGMSMEDVDLIGSHGQTISHLPEFREDCGKHIASTLQIGEGAVIARRTGVVTVSDFRVMDMAAGGQGAPLVPYSDYVLYSSDKENIALLNVGGIGNITVIPKHGREEDVVAFDTGPGNMVIDELMRIITEGKREYDKNGEFAAKGKPDREELDRLLADPYFKKPYPKTTGREAYGKDFTRSLYAIFCRKDLKYEDMVATATAFTAESVRIACGFSPCNIDRLIVSGGGAYNRTLLDMLSKALPKTTVCTQEDLGFSSDAKEAVAFAVLANETLSLHPNNICGVTGADAPQILGKINLV